ncbi:MAG: hypothetical protein HC890_05365 [Chloroflexaceae bacterium]|nr:hypothetical protein [Chloroflexaceae bacterium]
MSQAKNFFRKISDRLLPDRENLRILFREMLYPTDQVGKEGDSSPKVKEQDESYYRDKLAQKLRGTTEIKTPDRGRIDILTSSEIIEVKQVKLWRSALGQIISYGYFYPRHQKRIHLFGDKFSIDFRAVENICKQQGVKVSWEEDE